MKKTRETACRLGIQAEGPIVYLTLTRRRRRTETIAVSRRTLASVAATAILVAGDQVDDAEVMIRTVEELAR